MKFFYRTWRHNTLPSAWKKVMINPLLIKVRYPYLENYGWQARIIHVHTESIALYNRDRDDQGITALSIGSLAYDEWYRYHS